jgi:hypothetical protein
MRDRSHIVKAPFSGEIEDSVRAKATLRAVVAATVLLAAAAALASGRSVAGPIVRELADSTLAHFGFLSGP